jgi:hypothetical protein
MTTVIQSPGPPVTPAEAAVACAIWCCDKEPYSLQNTRGGRKTCQRLGHRKHSCVLHKLRKKSGNKLTTTNKVPGVEASPRIPPGVRGNDTSRVLIPDTIVDGNKVIDAKFPCETDDVHKKGFTKGAAKMAYPSDGRLGSAMTTSKEDIDYKKIDGGMKTECMTPADAAAKKGSDCECTPNDAPEEEEEEEDE